MQTFTTKTIRDIALESPETTRVFEEFKIDYCCGGRKPFDEACLDAGLDSQLVAQKIEAAMKASVSREEGGQPKKETASELIDHIIGTHHIFTVEEIERLTPLMEKVCQRHGEQHPDLFELQAVFSSLADSLIPHMRKEEAVLFPYIQMLESSLTSETPLSPPQFWYRLKSDPNDDGRPRSRRRSITKNASYLERLYSAGRCLPKFHRLVRWPAGPGKGSAPPYPPRKQCAFSSRGEPGTKYNC